MLICNCSLNGLRAEKSYSWELAILFQNYFKLSKYSGFLLNYMKTSTDFFSFENTACG